MTCPRCGTPTRCQRRRPQPTVAEDRPLTTDGVLVATRRVLVAFAVLTLLATNQLLVVARFTDRFFAWTISVRPSSAFLGAAYAAGFVLAVLALRRIDGEMSGWRSSPSPCSLC